MNKILLTTCVFILGGCNVPFVGNVQFAGIKIDDTNSQKNTQENYNSNAYKTSNYDTRYYHKNGELKEQAYNKNIDKTNPQQYSIQSNVPKGGGVYKLGKPYTVAGITYTPKEEPNYDKVGNMSWYGHKFHGRKTSNGEIFDMNRLTVAHPTLPLPSYVKITNLKNGLTRVARANDRGPYAKDRIMDGSMRLAEELGYKKYGTAKVRVQYVGKAPLNGDDTYMQRANEILRKNPRALVGGLYMSMYRGGYKPASTQHNTSPVPMGTSNIQVASFKDRNNALSAKDTLQSVGNVNISNVMVNNSNFYRVTMVNIPNHEVQQKLGRIRNSGFTNAKVTR